MKPLLTTELRPAPTPAEAPAFKKKPEPPLAVKPDKAFELIVRAAVVQAVAHAKQWSVEETRARIAKDHPRYDEDLSKIVCRAATAPATTFEESWAAEFVVAMGADLIKALMPKSAFAQLASQGMHLTFTIGEILVPNYIPSSGGRFIREGEPIPVIHGMTSGQMLTRKKVASIVSYSAELAEGAVATLEGMLRTRIQESATLAVDAVLLSDEPGSDFQPAGLLNGAIAVTSTGGMQADLQALAEGLFSAANHHVRAPVLIMNIGQAFAARLQSFREIIPFIVSPAVEAGTVIMLDAGDFACAGGQVPRFEISKEAALHFEDTNPEHISDVTLATPVLSLWQIESLGLRMILEVDWCLRRPGLACYMQGVQWKLGGGP